MVQNLRSDMQGFQSRKDGSALVSFNTSQEMAMELMADKPKRVGVVMWIPADALLAERGKE